MNDYVLTALVERRRVMLGEMHTLQAKVYQLQSDLTALDAVIKQLDPEYELSVLRPKYRRQPTPAEYAAISRSTLDTLRVATEPLTVKAITEQIMTGRGLDPGDGKTRRAMSKRVDMALRYQRTNGMVRSRIAESGAVVWEIDG